MTIALSLAAIILLIFLSAFFNGSETALTAASRARMHSLEEDGNAPAALVNRVLSRPEKMIGTVLLGNTLVDVLAAALASNIAVQLYGEVGVAYATAIITILIVIFAAVLPKTYALAYADRVALLVAPVMQVLIYVLTPFTRAIEFIVRGILLWTPGKADDEANILAAHEEIRGTIDLQAREGTVAKIDAEMLGGVLDLRDLQVADIMVHRTKMETIDVDDPPAKILDFVLRSQYTRVPLWKDEPENIVGVLHTKDLLQALSRTNWDPDKLDIMKSASEPWFVPDTTTLKDQLNQFLKKKVQMALVVDEYGEVQGLITLEDILEEIVGQITDEHDMPDSHIRMQSDGTVNVDGTVAIRDLNRHLDWNLPDDEATTVAGLVIHEAQTIPEPGQVFTFHGYRFEILRKSRNKITAIRIKPVALIEKASPTAAPARIAR
ncbi:HlyC/CorC family transporter [Hyphomicrobium sp.]|uniref:HlyC/CorC family transporter n=1 Tax=Hyphomicrobium sp. TaxID=82 RepID=UPI002D77357C|nr:HlyC/CorC family transporter [Hyphomicrobium sp.]HET6391111.1 HlyC/CorC family transporter [Hyphomicrobium sp.]